MFNLAPVEKFLNPLIVARKWNCLGFSAKFEQNTCVKLAALQKVR
jgi:hypothetical protein